MLKSSKKRKTLSFVMYEETNIPKYYEVKKNLLRFILIGFPVVSLISLTLIVLGIVYFKNINNIVKRQEPKIIKKLKNNNIDISNKLVEIKKFNINLQTKLASKKIKSLDVLNLIRFSPGQENKSRFSTILIHNARNTPEIVPLFDEKNVYFNFNLANNSPTGMRQTGYLFVIMKTSKSIWFYPEEGLQENTFSIAFNRGEVFGFERFRPVKTIFKRPNIVDHLIFKILLFSKLGDLIHHQIVEYKDKN